MISTEAAAQYLGADPETFTRIFGPADVAAMAKLAEQHQAERGTVAVVR